MDWILRGQCDERLETMEPAEGVKQDSDVGTVGFKGQRDFKMKAVKTQCLRRRKTRTYHNKRTVFRASYAKRPALSTK